MKAVWITGFPGSGKTSLGKWLVLRMFGFQTTRPVLLDGDALRGCWPGLGFSPSDRLEQAFRAARLARLLACQGLTPIAALVSPDRAVRARAREEMFPVKMIEVYLATSLEECRRRKPKVYANAPYPIEDVYEPPEEPAFRFDESHSREMASWEVAFSLIGG